ncbi:hypothetical protein QOT17_010860 [Balamuthia mandrillaris]
MQEKQDAQRLLATAEFRRLPPMERARKLIEDTSMSVRKAAELTGVTKSSLHRAIKAHEAGRELGRVGRPRILSAQEEEELKKWIVEREEQKANTTFEQFKTKVEELWRNTPNRNLAKGAPVITRGYMLFFCERHHVKITKHHGVLNQ